MNLETLEAISPIDGRYRYEVEEISKYFSEYSLIKNRVLVEVKWLKKLLLSGKFINEDVEKIVIDKLENINNEFDVLEAQKIKEIEKTTKHDVKAVEYYLRDKLEEKGLSKYNNLIHLTCTSEDINNLAYGIMINGLLNNVMIPNMEKMINLVHEKANEYRNIPMLSHTHGQSATPTTVGKELEVFVYRWNSILKYIKEVKLRGKFSGAVGNYNAHIVSYPNIDWVNFTKEFVEELGLEYNPLTTQIESHDIICVLFSFLKLFNNVTMDYNSDMWIYISKGYFKQKVVKGEVGSSVMPHKVNPINHENSMANIRMANCIFDNFTSNLQVSRMQRDLSDSSLLRNVGVSLAHSMISVRQTMKATEKMEVNSQELEEDLKNNPEVISEAIQTVLRKNGVANGYEMLKELTRGKRVSIEEFRVFISGLEINKQDKERLLKLTPENYIGLANKIF